ncbi:zinc finger protein 569-like [Toxorhynchites rutilus septentrionalis]|uniref:zinc finger protein 569-like n=1 Tax=Toxorhynchites rutilus septentrionalis TaxID=329112 RepID=UPI002479A056|nr:zinc finger protein 569-like [Toxorhynchites rutilus septentrionalis]
MPRRCSVVGCQTNRDYYEPGVRFFPFPREYDQVMRERWRQLIGRGWDWKIPTLAAVCQKHFAPCEISSDRRLPDSTVPTLQLPQDSLNSEENDECSETDIGTNHKQRKQTAEPPAENVEGDEKQTQAEYFEEEEEIHEEVIISHCRFCTTELDVDSGLDISIARHCGQVRDSVWEMCMVACEDTSVEDCLIKICDSCWNQLQTFENFLVSCHDQQHELFKFYGEKLKTTELEDEFVEEIRDESIVPDKAYTFEQVIVSEDPTEDNVSKPDLECFPSLEGLSIGEMIEVLDKIPASQKKTTIMPDEECWDCGQIFPSRNQKKEHRKNCALIGNTRSLRNRSYTCEICKKDINTRVGYRVHLLKIHGDHPVGDDCPEELKRLQSKKRLQCPLCPDRFQQVHQLKYHIRTHQSKKQTGKIRTKSKGGNGGVCQLCGKSFQNPCYMETHMKFHLKERNFPCEQCDKRFYTKHDMKDHQKTMHAEHTLLCGSCGKSFGTRRAFIRHSKIHDEASNAHLCSYCPRSFPTAWTLKYHVMKHTGEKRHRCELCGHEFRFRYMLTQHKIKAHQIDIEGVKLYKRKRKRCTNTREDEDDDGEEEEELQVEQADDSGEIDRCQGMNTGSLTEEGNSEVIVKFNENDATCVL